MTKREAQRAAKRHALELAETAKRNADAAARNAAAAAKPRPIGEVRTVTAKATVHMNGAAQQVEVEVFTATVRMQGRVLAEQPFTSHDEAHEWLTAWHEEWRRQHPDTEPTASQIAWRHRVMEFDAAIMASRDATPATRHALTIALRSYLEELPR